MFKYLNIHKHSSDYMATKTITVKTAAYEALKDLKEAKESFSDVILRVAKKKSLDEFYGVLSKESSEKLEKTIKGLRKRQDAENKKRLQKIVGELSY